MSAYVFALGPLEAHDGAAFLACVFAEGRMEQPIFAASEQDCFAEVRRRHPSARMHCEPDLGRLGARFGFEPAALPDDVRAVRAGIAVNLASRGLAPSVAPPVIMELLAASRDFLAVEAWSRFDSNALLFAHVEGAITAKWEASVLGSGGQEYGVGLYLDPGAHARMLSARSEAAAAQLRARMSALSITFEDEPGYAAFAIEELTGIGFVPVPVRVDKGKLRPMEAKPALALSACMRAAASKDRVGTASAGNVKVRVSLRAG